MPVTNITVNSDPTQNYLDLDVSVDEMDVVVQPGDFVSAGVSYSLEGEHRFTATPNGQHGTSIKGMLAKDTATGKVEVVVDEVLQDGVDTEFNFDTSPDFDLIEMLFRFVLPPSAMSLSSVDVEVLKIGVLP